MIVLQSRSHDSVQELVAMLEEWVLLVFVEAVAWSWFAKIVDYEDFRIVGVKRVLHGLVESRKDLLAANLGVEKLLNFVDQLWNTPFA